MKVQYHSYGLELDPETEKEEQDLKVLQKQINYFLALYTTPSKRRIFNIGINDPATVGGLFPDKYGYIFCASEQG